VSVVVSGEQRWKWWQHEGDDVGEETEFVIVQE
jgi:hypothetical protein